MHPITILLAFLALTLAGCGSSSGGGGGSHGGGTTPPPASIDKDGDLVDAFTGGIFAGTETDTTITVWQGDRLGEVTFHSTTLNRTITGADGYTFTSTRPGGAVWTFRVDYVPASHSLKLVRPSDTTHQATWTIIEPAPIGRG